MIAPILVLDRSNPVIGLQFVDQHGTPVEIDAAFDGFFVTRDDANCLLTLALEFIKRRDAQHG